MKEKPALGVFVTDKRSSKVMYQQLHSRSALVKRTLHVVFIVAGLYFFATLTYQVQTYIASLDTSNTAFGAADSRLEQHTKLAQLAASQWHKVAVVGSDLQQEYLSTWVALPFIDAIAVYRQDGGEVIRVPASFSIREAMTDLANSVVVSANYTLEDNSTGYLIVIVNEYAFFNQKKYRIADQIDILFSALFLGVILGIYLLRGVLKLRENLRK